MDVLLEGLANLFTAHTFFYLLLGIAVGLVVGILPALGTTAGMALIVPFLYGMDLHAGVAMMTGVLAVVNVGDVVTSVLMGIPGGGSGSQATVLDGYPLTKRGEGARALSAAYMSSIVGGVFGTIILTFVVLVAGPVVLSFGTGELLLLTLLGVTMVSMLSGPSLVKGLIACGLGLLFGSVGGAAGTGEFRMMGDYFYLIDGVPLAPVALGLFALPEIVTMLRRSSTISSQGLLKGGWLQGMKDVIANKWLVLCCSVIGTIIGALPIGGSEWFAYGHAVQTCKPKDNFGKGDIRGVIAPESANNANTSGALIPTLVFGIPGSGSTAIFLGGMALLGLSPGPDMVGPKLSITYSIIWTLIIAHIIGAGICFLISGQLARLTVIKIAYLGPILLTIVFLGAYQANLEWGDLIVLMAVGLIGLYLRRFGYSRPAFLIGFVLSHKIEAYIYQTMQFYTLDDLLARPLMWVLLAVVVLSLVLGLKYRPSLETEGKSTQLSRSELVPQMLFLGLIGIVATWVLIDLAPLSLIGKIFPYVAAVATLLLVAIGFFQFATNGGESRLTFDGEVRWRDHSEGYQVGLFHHVAWVLTLFGLIYLVGFILGIATFMVLFLSFEARSRLAVIANLTTVTVASLALFSYAMTITLPRGMLQDFVTLPWPLG